VEVVLTVVEPGVIEGDEGTETEGGAEEPGRKTLLNLVHHYMVEKKAGEQQDSMVGVDMQDKLDKEEEEEFE
jgi:hypothetical protein